MHSKWFIWICIQKELREVRPYEADSAEALVLSRFRHSYLLVLDIKTTVSTWHEEIGSTSFPLTRYRKHVKNIFALCPFIKTYPRLVTNHLFNIYKMYKIYHCSLYPITKKLKPKSISLIIHLTNTIDLY